MVKSIQPQSAPQFLIGGDRPLTRSIERDRERATTWAGTTHNTGQPVLPYYVIARYGAKGLELLQFPLESGEETLPVFSSEVAARDLLLASALEQGWYVRESYAGELVSLLIGLCAGVEWVLVNPVLGEQAAEGNPADIAHWESFVGYLLGSPKYRLFPTRPHNRMLAAVTLGTDNLLLGREALSSS
jgi:hypothetical protein